eukprot:3177494-Ditylum_brightwellii.AAC.1
MKLPMCIAVDAPGDIPQMQRLVLSWSWRCLYAVAVDGCSKNETRFAGSVDAGFIPSVDAAYSSMVFVLSVSFRAPFLELLE